MDENRLNEVIEEIANEDRVNKSKVDDDFTNETLDYLVEDVLKVK